MDPLLVERFWERVEKSDGCWLWRGSLLTHGYGGLELRRRADPKRKVHKAHRLSWEIHFGPIPEGMSVCHHCDTPPCVRPDHLFLGTALDNAHDKMRKGRLRVGNVRGEQNGAALLTEDQVREIRYAAAAGVKQVRLAETYGVSQMAVSQVVRRVTWRHVEDSTTSV